MNPTGPSPPDRELIAPALAGDTSAFDEIARRYSDELYRIAWRCTGNREDAEDAAAEALLRLYDRLQSVRGIEQLGPWLRTVTVNLCLDGYRKRRYRSGRLEDYARAVPTVSTEVAPEATSVAHETREALERALSQLSPRQRTAFVLFEMRGMNVEEVAREMGCSPGTVKAQLHRARNRLRDLLGHFLRERGDLS
jgi:RNA polymerase sigma-70 factor, ECF subfamily